jgi:pantoate--beta-alanine ligase
MIEPQIVKTVKSLRQTVRFWRQKDMKIALVPTMGALHEGHLALMRDVQSMGCKVITSIFVNPTQFAPTEDLAKYPRPFTADMEKLTALGVDALFYPDVDEMYGAGFCTTIALDGPASVGLEDRFRPGHFAGVATVVAKLLLQALPDIAIFGEKDYQQLAVIRQMVQDLNIPVEILGGKTIREADGLALSSRNIYLLPKERHLAPEIHHVLKWCAGHFGKEPLAHVLNAARIRLESFGFVIDYLELREAVTLKPVEAITAPCRLLFAGRLGKTRLIDNIEILPS